MIVEELIGWLKNCPRDSEIFVSSLKDFGNESKSKQVNNVIIDYGNDCVILLVK